MKVSLIVILFLFCFESCLIWLAQTDSDDYGPQPCSNGSAIFNVSMRDKIHADAYCMPYDNCSRYCYDAVNCSAHAKAPPNKQIVLTKINFTQLPDHIEYDFRCCASSHRLLKCKWTDVEGEISVDPENKTISDFKVINLQKNQFSVKICKIDRDAGQKPTAVCFADVCHADGVCKGKYEPTNQFGPAPKGVTVDYTDEPYGLIALAALAALAAIPSGCKDFTLSTTTSTVTYTNRNAAGYSAIASTATVTCVSGSFVSGTTVTTQTITCQSDLTWSPATVTCDAGCVVPAAVANSQYSPAVTATSITAGASLTLVCTGTSSVADTCTTSQTQTCTASSTLTPPVSSCAIGCAVPTVTLGTYSTTLCTVGTTTFLPSSTNVVTLTCTGTAYIAGQGCAQTLTMTCTSGVLSPALTLSATTCVASCALLLTTNGSYVPPVVTDTCVATNTQLLDTKTANFTCNTATDYVAGTCVHTLTTTCTTGALSPATSCSPACPLPPIDFGSYDNTTTCTVTPTTTTVIAALSETSTTTITCKPTYYIADCTMTGTTTCTSNVLVPTVNASTCVEGCTLTTDPNGVYDSVACAGATATVPSYLIVTRSSNLTCNAGYYLDKACTKTTKATCATPINPTYELTSTTTPPVCTAACLLNTTGLYGTFDTTSAGVCDTTYLLDTNSTKFTCNSTSNIAGTGTTGSCLNYTTATCTVANAQQLSVSSATCVPYCLLPTITSSVVGSYTTAPDCTSPNILPGDSVTKATLTCNAGYFLVGNAAICATKADFTCKNGVTTVSPNVSPALLASTQCVLSCTVLIPTPTQGTYTTLCGTTPDQIPYGSSALFACNPNYIMKGVDCKSNTTESCNGGQLSNPLAVTIDNSLCVQSCTVPKVADSVYKDSAFNASSNCATSLLMEVSKGGTITCNTNYTLAGLTCLDTRATLSCSTTGISVTSPAAITSATSISCVQGCVVPAVSSTFGTYDSNVCAGTNLLASGKTTTLTCAVGHTTNGASIPITCTTGNLDTSVTCA